MKWRVKTVFKKTLAVYNADSLSEHTNHPIQWERLFHRYMICIRCALETGATYNIMCIYFVERTCPPQWQTWLHFVFPRYHRTQINNIINTPRAHNNPAGATLFCINLCSVHFYYLYPALMQSPPTTCYNYMRRAPFSAVRLQESVTECVTHNIYMNAFTKCKQRDPTYYLLPLCDTSII